MVVASRITDLKAVAVHTIGQRWQFAQSLRDSFRVSNQQWQPMEQILALTTASRFNIYAYYPHLFKAAFPPVEAEVLQDLAWIGRCALDYILLYDYLLDAGKLPDPVILLSSYAFQREYTMRLQHYFSPDSALWHYVAAYESETARSLIEEQMQWHDLSVSATSEFGLDVMRRQAIGKAAISRLAIVSLACLTNSCDTDIMCDLIASNDHFNFARQVTDDLLDWRKDYETGRYSCLLANALKFLGVTVDTTPENYPTPNRVGSVIYTQFADEYLTAANASLTEAVRLAETYHTGPDWLENLTNMRATVSRHSDILADAKRIANASKPIIPRLHTQQYSVEALSSALDAAQTFLLQRQSPDGCWRDFATSAGESEDWMTGYVGWSLLSSGRLPTDVRERSVQWLIQAQFPQGGWGYHRHVVVDADSTAWCTRFMSLAAQCGPDRPEQNINQAVSDGLSILLAHQHVDGSFSTYFDPEPIRAYIQADETRDLSGWCMPQLCVTAAVMATLHEAAMPCTTKWTTQSTVKYVLEQQQSRGFWQSYWWDGPHYATVHLMQALSSLPGVESKAAVTAGQAWLRSVQNADGSWGGSAAESEAANGLPFNTALGVQGLLTDNSLESHNAIQRGVEWLVKHQDPDGGWQASATLLLPETHDKQPWLTHHWPLQMRGTGIARRDHRRIFTTATVLKALVSTLSQNLT